MATTLTLSASYFYVISNITLIVTTLPFIAHDVLPSELQRALLVSIFPLISLPANLLIGPVADRLGRRRFLLVGSLACAVLFVASSVITDAWQAILLRGLTAVFMSMISCSIFSAIPDYFDQTQTLKVTGYVSAASSLAQLLAIPLTSPDRRNGGLALVISSACGLRLPPFRDGFPAATDAICRGTDKSTGSDVRRQPDPFGAVELTSPASVDGVCALFMRNVRVSVDVPIVAAHPTIQHRDGL